MADQEKEEASPQDRRWEELKFLQDTLFKVWTAYMVFYIWFATAIFGALSYVWRPGEQVKLGLSSNQRTVGGIVLVLCIGAAIVVTVTLGRYSTRVLDRVRALIAQGGLHAGLDQRTLLPASVIAIAVPACCLTLCLGLGLWAYVAFPGN
jgi:hypothetical protein